MKMSRKKIIALCSTVFGLVVIPVIIAVIFKKDSGPDFTGKTQEEIKAYFKSEEYQNMNINEQIAIKKKAYPHSDRQGKQHWVEQAKTFLKLPPQQKVAYLDEMIDKMVSKAVEKQRYTQQTTSGAKQVSAAKGGYVGKSAQAGSSNSVKQSSGKNWDSAENFRSWSEEMEPEERAYMMELKEAFIERMEQRGIKIW